MGLGVGGLVDERGGTVEGLSYLVFVAPGVLAASALQTAAGDSLWPILSGSKWQRFFHGMTASPLRPSDVMVGRLLWTVVRLSITSSVFLVVAVAFGAVPSPWGVLAVPAAVLGGCAVAAPLSAYSAAQDSDLSFPLVMRLGVIPLFLFSGTFF